MSNLSQEEVQGLRAELEAAKAEKARLEAELNGVIHFKVSVKGAVSLYGHGGRFPTTLYASQWEKVLAEKENLLAFINSNRSQLTTKA